jgi:hypothetical protein
VPRRLGILVLLAVTACTGSSEAPVAAPTSSATTATASPAPPSAPTAVSAVSEAPPSSVLLVAADPVGNAGLYSLAPRSRHAQLVRDVDSHGDSSITSVSLSAGPTPTICAVWNGQAEPPQGSHLRCYAPGDSLGRIVRSENPLAVAVRGDGRAVAWLEAEANSNTALVVADLAGDVARVRYRAGYAADLPPDGGIPEGVNDVDWLGPRTLALTDVGDSDEGKGLCVLDLDRPRERTAIGFGRCLEPSAAEARRRYDRFEHATALPPGTVLTVERGHRCCDDPLGPPGRAVVVRLSDGAVREVVATPASGRAVVDVTGGPRAVIYVTAGEDEAKGRIVYVRWPGEAHGAAVSGLLELTRDVAAQP